MIAENEELARLCRGMARRFTRSADDREDLEQVARLGLLKATRRYDVGRGVPFAAFARRAIRGELSHYVRDHERAVRMPRAWWELRAAERAHTDAFVARHERMPAPAEIARELGTSATAVAVMRGGVVADANVADRAAPEDAAERRIVIADAIAALDRDERLMILGVYFFGYSQSEMGGKLGIPQRRASRLHARALHHLRLAIGETP